MADTEFKTIVAHFSPTVSQAIVDYATDVVFLSSRYLFTRREGKQQYAYCTHCRQDAQTSGLRHGELVSCPACGSECTVKANGMGRKHLIDEAYFVYYERSQVNPKAITARGLYAVRDYREDYRHVPTRLAAKALYVFEPGTSVMWEQQWVWYNPSQKLMNDGGSWRQHKSVSSLFRSSMTNKPCFRSLDSIQAAVQGTPFQYSTWEEYVRVNDGGDFGNVSDMVKFFDLAAKYPCIEYLTKLGLRDLVDAKLRNERTYGAVNWRAKSPLKVLRVSKQEMNALRTSSVPVDPWLLYLLHASKKDGSRLPLPDLIRMHEGMSEYSHADLQKVLTHVSLRKVDWYVTRQLAVPEVQNTYRNGDQILHTWKDYLAECEQLGLDTSNESIMFPPNLYRAHQNNIQQIKVKEDEALRAKMAARAKALQKLRFEALGFLVRPALDSRELIKEGEALNHCVGNYARRYATGEVDIFVLRRTDDPDTPFFTMEIRDGHVLQCRGARNCQPTEPVQAFVDLFVTEKLNRTRHAKTKEGIAV